MVGWMVSVLLSAIAIAPDGPQLVSSEAVYLFSERMTFHARIENTSDIKSTSVWVRDGSGQVFQYPASKILYSETDFEAFRDLTRQPIFPFSRINYWWQVETTDDRLIVYPENILDYPDNRFSWHSVSIQEATISWIGDRPSPAQPAAELIQITWRALSNDLSLTEPIHIRVWIYNRMTDMRAGLGNAGQGWEGGMSDGAAGNVLIAASSDAEGQRMLAALVPHETAHIALSARWGRNANQLPRWMSEGFAAQYELDSRPEYETALQDALRLHNLFPIMSLCKAFPGDEKAATIAYAESQSFVRYLKNRYGMTAMIRAMSNSTSGTDCALSAEEAFGTSLDLLDAEWRTSLQPTSADSGSGLSGVVLSLLTAWILFLVAGGYILRRKILSKRGSVAP
jgi:hypothetical protein